MLHCGLRLAEVTHLRPGSINLTKGKLTARGTRTGIWPYQNI